MGDPYLLAASLLTGGQMLTPPPPALPLKGTDTLLALNVAQSNAFEPLVTQKIIPTVEISSPEFSQQRFSSQTDTPPITPILAAAATEILPSIEALLKPKPANPLTQFWNSTFLPKISSSQSRQNLYSHTC
jgi:hypothetical protein